MRHIPLQSPYIGHYVWIWMVGTSNLGTRIWNGPLISIDHVFFLLPLWQTTVSHNTLRPRFTQNQANPGRCCHFGASHLQCFNMVYDACNYSYCNGLYTPMVYYGYDTYHLQFFIIIVFIVHGVVKPTYCSYRLWAPLWYLTLLKPDKGLNGCQVIGSLSIKPPKKGKDTNITKYNNSLPGS